MKLPIVAWICLWGAWTAVGVLLCLLLHPGALLALGLAVGAAAAVLRPTVRRPLGDLGLSPPSRMTCGLISSSATLAVVGLGHVSLSLGASTVLMHLVTGMAAVVYRSGTAAARGGRGRLRAQGHPVRPGAAPVWVPRLGDAAYPDISARLSPIVARWSDDQLCRAWQGSHHRLGSDDVRLVAAVAWERQLYLDELERRHPRSFNRWLGACPQAQSNPQRFLPAVPLNDDGTGPARR